MDDNEDIQISRAIGNGKHIARLRNNPDKAVWTVFMVAYNKMEFVRCFSDVVLVATEEEAVATGMAFIKRLDDKKYLKNLCSIPTAHEAGERE